MKVQKIEINVSNDDMLKVLANTNMNYYGNIPYGTIHKQNIETNLFGQLNIYPYF